MQYQAGTGGRIFYARLDDGEDLHAAIVEIAGREKIKCAWFQIFGGLKSAGVVTGPKKPVMPPDPVWAAVRGAREILGTGTVLWDRDKPLIHLHAALGHHGETMTGCVRKDSTVYLVTELIIQEILGIDVTRPWYEEGGFNRPAFGSGKNSEEAG
ncbi:MAG: DNA-binding protein [Desulfobulbaceae bacterium]|nr:DNA-binding protein [Desulfobulbaceae bacterium]